MNKIYEIDEENLTVKCDAGISWLKLIETLLESGLVPKCYPTSYRSSCVAGFIATAGKAGIGVLNHGEMKDTLISITFVKPDGTIEKITKDSGSDLTFENIAGSVGVYGVISVVELSLTVLKESMEMVGYSFKSIKNASEYFFSLKNNQEFKPFFLSLSDKKFEKLSHKTTPTRKFFVYAAYFDELDSTSKAKSFAKDNAEKMDGLFVEDWYLKEKWDDISTTELNLARICKNPIFQEYWISDDKVDRFYEIYNKKIKNLNYRNAFYMIAGSDGKNRIKLFGLSDIANSREFFGIKALFNDMTQETYKQNDSLYAIGVVNTFYFMKFNPEKVVKIRKLKEKLDPEDLVNSYRFIKAKMKYWRIILLLQVAKVLYRIVR